MIQKLMDTVISRAQAIKDRLDPARAEARKEAEEKNKAIQAQRRLDLRNMMATAWGRRLLVTQLHQCGYHLPTLIDGTPSPVMEGMRGVAIKLANDLRDADPKAFQAVLLELYPATDASNA